MIEPAYSSFPTLLQLTLSSETNATDLLEQINMAASFASPQLASPTSIAAGGSSSRLMKLGGGVLFFHVMNSVLQEAVFHLPNFNHSLMLSCMQTFCIAAIAFFEFKRAGLRRKAPLLTYFLLSVFTTTSVVLTNEASRRLNYPTQVIFKSSKLLFVMALRWLVLRGTALVKKKRQGIIIKEIASSIMIVAGLVVFTYATSAAKMTNAKQTASSDVFLGVLAIIVALICDALLYIGEEKYCFSAHETSNTEVILYLYSFAAINSGFSLVSSGQLSDSLAYLMTTPTFVALVVGFSLCNFCGTHFLLHIVSEFDSNSAVMVTSVRKMFTVLCSFVVYPKPFTLIHFVGLVGVSYGIWMHEGARAEAKREEKEQKEKDKGGPEQVV